MSEVTNLKIPPQNVDAEKALLGSVMLNPDSLYEILEYIKPAVFYSEKHNIIFESIMDLVSKSEPVDLLTVSSSLKNKNKLKEIGGDVYLTELASFVPSASNILHYAKIVSEKYIKRKLIEASEKISSIGFDEEEEIEKSIDMAEKEIFEISSSLSSSEFAQMETVLKEAYERLESLQSGTSALRGIPTGFSSLDQKLSGFQRGDLIIVAARPSVGKTALALEMARKIAVNEEKSVAVFSLEMSKGQLTDRMLAAEANVDAWKMRTGNLDEKVDMVPIRDAVGRLSEAKIYIDDNSYNNILRMKSACRKLKRKNGLDLIIVDYLQLMAPLSKGKNVSVVQEITEISRGLKQLAKELDVPVIALSQLSRNIEHRGENAQPRLADLRDSGSIEQDADVVIFIHRDKSDEDGKRLDPEVKLIIEKHRNGSTGVVSLYFNEDKISYTEMDKNSFNDFDTINDSADDEF